MSETLLVVVGLVVFVYLAYQGGKVLNSFKNRGFTRAWQPLVEIINGAVQEDPQGGGASSWLVGQWKGKTIHARMTPNVRSSDSTGDLPGVLQNQFAVGVANQTGRSSWHTDRSFALSPGAGQITVSSKDEALAERLRAAGVVTLLEAAQCAVARFEQHSGYLFVEEEVTPLWIPPPERFIVLLDLAVELARAQAAVNAPK
jgi:hypothetical protein